MRILDLTHDSYVEAASDPGVRVTRAPLGGSNAPWRSRRAVSAPAAAAALARLAWARAGGYEWVIAPPVLVDRTAENPGWQRALKAIAATIADRRGAGQLASSLLLWGRCRYAVVDISDRRLPSPFALGVIRPHHYFKRNLVAGAGPRECRAWVLPISLPISVLREDVDSTPIGERPVDLFVAGDYKNEPRRLLREIAARLDERGWSVDVLEHRVGHREFLTRLSRARLAGAVEGWGYHTWRMYEAAALGSVPVVTRAPPGMWSWFTDGENCVELPATVEAGLQRIESVLRDRDGIARISTEARSRAERHHDSVQIADWLVGRLRGDEGPAIPGGSAGPVRDEGPAIPGGSAGR